MEKEGDADWVIGEDLPTGEIRSLSNPANTANPSALKGAACRTRRSLAEWVLTCLDNFGIHINSTITSHAFYMAATDLETSPEMSPAETAFLFYRGWTEYLKGVPSPTLEDARAAALQATEDIFGEESPVYETVKGAFSEVGLNGVAQPSMPNCKEKFQCSFARALQKRQSASGESASRCSAPSTKPAASWP